MRRPCQRNGRESILLTRLLDGSGETSASPGTKPGGVRRDPPASCTVTVSERGLRRHLAYGSTNGEDVTDAAMDSHGHRENLINPANEDFGICRQDRAWVVRLGTERP
jgi:hypothetical protein